MSGIQIGVTKTPDGKLAGWTADDQAKLDKMRAKVKRLPVGDHMILSYKVNRSLPHHKKFFSLVQAVVDNSEVYDTREKALDAIKIAAGHVDWIPSPITGEMVPKVKSIAFDKMDQAAFDQFYEAAVRGVLRWIVPHMEMMDLEQAIEMVASY